MEKHLPKFNLTDTIELASLKGKIAHRAHKPLNDNPYVRCTTQYRKWEESWCYSNLLIHLATHDH